MVIDKEFLRTIHTETIKFTQWVELGQAAEKGFEEIKNTISCKGVYSSAPCKKTNTYPRGCSLKYFCAVQAQRKEKQLDMAIEVLRAFNRAGINYGINEDGSFNFHNVADLERASEISQEIQKRY